MVRRPPRSTRTDTLLPDPALSRSLVVEAGAEDRPGEAVHRHDVEAERGPSVLAAGLEAVEQLRHGRPGVGLGPRAAAQGDQRAGLFDTRSEEHTSELQSLMRISYAVFCLTQHT